MKISKEIIGIALRHLGVASFGKSEGKFTITEEQKTKLSGLFGQGFAREFAEKIAEWDGDMNFSSIKRPAASAASGASTTPNSIVSTAIAAAAAASEKGEETPEAIAAREDATSIIMTAISGHAAETLAVELRNVQASLASEKQKAKALEEVVAALSAAPEGDPLPEGNQVAIKGKEGVRKVMKIDYSNPLYAAAKAFLESGNANSYSAATIEIADLKAEFGTYLSQNQNNLEVIKKIFSGFTSAKYFKPVLATTEYRASRALITSISQQFRPKWTGSGKVKFTPITIKNFRHKINFPIIPAEVLDSYFLKMYDEGLSPEQMPITKFIIDELIEPALLQDLEMRMAWKAKFVDHSNDAGNTPAPAEDSMDGIETILVDAKASGDKGIYFFKKFKGVDYSNFDYTTATAAQIVKFVNAFVDSISPLYRPMKMNLFCSDEFKKAYKRAYKEVWGSNAGVSGDFGDDKVDYSNNMLVAPDGMYGSPILFSTPSINMLSLRHKNEVPKIINNIQVVDYEVKIFGEYWYSVGFAVGEAVFAFVPAGYDPKAQITKNWGEASDYQEWQGEGSTSSAGGI